MAVPLIVRKGEGKNVRLGPDDWLFRLRGAETDGRFDLMEATITHLQGPPLHLHHDQDDTILVVAGTLKVQVRDELFDLHPGDLVCAPKGVPHTFANVEKEPVQIINIMTPGGFDQALEEFASLPPGPPDPKVMEEMAQKYSAEFLGPPIPVRLGLM